jgi:hypothetical protein
MFSLVLSLAMMGAVDKKDDWSAWVNHMPVIAPGGPFLMVSGTVDVPAGYKAELVVAKPQGFNPEQLLLHLKLVKLQGNSTKTVKKQSVRLRFPDGNYKSVLIRYSDGRHLSFKVRHVY